MYEITKECKKSRDALNKLFFISSYKFRIDQPIFMQLDKIPISLREELSHLKSEHISKVRFPEHIYV